jgi:16S rRNA (cytidine1402-2'-O)-methyltransferase
MKEGFSLNIQKSYPQQPTTTGTLYLVATPIGNLEDMTFRAIRILKEVAWIAAEDTRQSRKLLTHYEIHTRLVSYHEHNKQASGKELVRLLLEGESVALVTDAGLPAISDPGYDLVRLCIESNVAVVPIPGANAALCALIVSGLLTERFLFIGFLPRDKKHLQEELIKLREMQTTLLFYESPHRLLKTLNKMHEVWGNREIALVREISKRFEEVARGTLQESLIFLEDHPPLGEYCIVVKGNYETEDLKDAWWAALSLEEHMEYYLKSSKDRKEAIKKTAIDRGVPKREVYNELL